MKRLRPRPARRGLTSVAVLVLLVVIAILGASLLKLVGTYRQRTLANVRAIQADLLADAGLDRAFAKLAARPDYEGERWEIPAEALGLPETPDGGPAAVVVIRVEAAGADGARTVRVQADHPADPVRRVRASREAALPDAP